MSETPFYKTRMGQQFYDRTMPALVKQLARMNDLLEHLVKHRLETDRENTDADS